MQVAENLLSAIYVPLGPAIHRTERIVWQVLLTDVLSYTYYIVP